MAGAITIVLAALLAPLLVVGLCLSGILPSPMLSQFADFLHRIFAKGRYAPKPTRKFDFNKITPQLIVGRQPRSVEDLNMLHKEHNVRAVICLNEASELYVSSKQIKKSGLDLKRLHLPVPDYQGASEEQLIKAVDFVKKQIEEDETSAVFVHCNGGKGRSAAVAVAYVMSEEMGKFEDFHEAVEYVRQQRPVTSKSLDRFPLSSSSRALFKYHATLNQKGDNKLRKSLSQYVSGSLQNFGNFEGLRDSTLKLVR